MVRHISVLCLITLFTYGCGSFFGDSYEDDVANDREIVNEIIKANPILDSAVKAGHYFLPYSSESGRITGELNISELGLNDSNFYFPKSIRKFRKVKSLLFASNKFTDLPPGIRENNWESVAAWFNRICNPSSETVAYLDKLVIGYGGPNWRDSQRCSDSITVDSP